MGADSVGSSLQAVNNRGEKATVGTFRTCSEHPHTDQHNRLHHVPLSLTPEEKAVPLLHEFEALGSLAGLTQINNTVKIFLAQGSLYCNLYRHTPACTMPALHSSGHTLSCIRELYLRNKQKCV